MFVYVGVGEGVREREGTQKSTCATVAKSGCGCNFERGTAAANGRQHWCQVVADGNDEMCDRRDQSKVLCPHDVCLIWLFLSMGN